ncbi:long-chain-fatty-acid--CoA ligase ACSBG2, partial [Biomphalaria glabrata]
MDFVKVSSSKTKLVSLDEELRFFNQGDVRDCIDQPIPAHNYFTYKLDQPVHMKMNESIPLSIIPSFFIEAVSKYADRAALVYENSTCPVVITYKGYYTAVLNAASSFIAMGLEQNGVVAMACYNSACHFISTLGAIFAGGIITDLYSFRKLSSLFSLLEDSKASFVVVDSTRKISQGFTRLNANLMRVNILLSLWNELPSLKAIILITEDLELENSRPNVYTWPTFLQLSYRTPVKKLAERLDQLAPNRCCAIFYGSDKLLEFSKPKGVLMSHDNLTFMATSFKSQIWTEESLKPNQTKREMSMEKRMLSYLSLSQAYSLVIEILLPIASGTTVFFVGPDIWEGQLVKTLQLIKPTVFFATSRTWKLMYDKIKHQFDQLTFFEKMLITNFKSTTEQLVNKVKSTIENQNTVQNFSIRSKLNAFGQKKLKKQLGLHKCSAFFILDGPLSTEVQEFYFDIGISIRNMLNSPFMSGPHLAEDIESGDNIELPGCATSFQSNLTNDNFELLGTGRHVCMGILHDLATFDNSDLFQIDLHVSAAKDEADNFVLTRSASDMSQLSNGYFVHTEAVEELIKSLVPVFSNCMLIGPNRPYFSVLMTLQ